MAINEEYRIRSGIGAYNSPERLPSRVKSGSPAWASECPLLGEEQTSISGGWMSAFSHKRTLKACASVRTWSALRYGKIPSEAARSALTSPLDLSNQIWAPKWGKFATCQSSGFLTSINCPRDHRHINKVPDSLVRYPLEKVHNDRV